MEQLDYATITRVIASWEQLRLNHDNYEAKIGARLFFHMFMNCPSTKPVFGVAIDYDMTDPEHFGIRKLAMTHGSCMVQVLGTAIEMLGPDMESLNEILVEIGVRHAKYGVQIAFFPAMGAALILALEEVLGFDVMTDPVKEAWMDTYDALSSIVMFAMTRERLRKDF
jgi:hemoglobin-like flavoprotein